MIRVRLTFFVDLSSVRFSVNLNLILVHQIGPVEKRISEGTEPSDLAAGKRTLGP